MKALTVRQPWASLIATGRKTIELRSWRTGHRGLFVLCAAARPPSSAGTDWPDLEMPRGAALAICELVDIRPATQADAGAACALPGPGAYAWIVRVVRRLEHAPRVSGRLGLWDCPDDALT